MELENGFGNLRLDQTVHINFLGDLVDYWSESCMKYNEMLNSLTMSMWCERFATLQSGFWVYHGRLVKVAVP